MNRRIGLINALGFETIYHMSTKLKKGTGLLPPIPPAPPAFQKRLDHLIDQCKQRPLSSTEQAELEKMLEETQMMTIRWFESLAAKEAGATSISSSHKPR